MSHEKERPAPAGTGNGAKASSSEPLNTLNNNDASEQSQDRVDTSADDKPTTMVDHALLLAANGFYVFPVRRNKVPCTSAATHPSERPRYGATRDREKIRANFKQFEHLKPNIGIETGTGFFVVEGDTREGHPKLKPGEGVEALDALIVADGGWPETRRAESATSSQHRYFTHPPGIIIRTGRLIPGVDGIDVLGDGGFVVAPPRSPSR